MKNIIMFLLLLGIAGTSYAQETSHLAFVSEYVRELGAIESIRATAEQEIKEKGSNQLASAIRNSTRVQLELRAEIGMLSGMNLNPPSEDLIKNIIDIYMEKIELHQQIIDIASELIAGRIAGPKPNVDYGKMPAQMPKITASLEYLDHSMFEVTALVFITLIDPKADSQGHVNHLVITKAERQQLIGEINSLFGSKLDKKNQNYIVGSASILRSILQKDYKSSDEPW
jgi:hypothetical protein